MAERIAIVSSPRSGNSWLRAMLRDGLQLPECAVHNYASVNDLPERCVFQLHWYREPNFQNFLSANDFRVITIARHPLDALISVLHFIRYEPATAEWLGGNCAIPLDLAGKAPASPQFLEYALSFGAENLLSISYQWWHDAAVVKVRYEDLVTDTENEIRRIASELGQPPDRMVDAIPANSLETFRALPNRHGWQGSVGLWRQLLPFEDAQRIFARHRLFFDTLGYSIEEAPLTIDEAERNWEGLLR